MGSAKQHPLWLDYIANIIRDTPQNQTVVEHTGPNQLCRTFAQYIAQHPEEMHDGSIRVLAINELANTGECQSYARHHQKDDAFCNSVVCWHEHGVSPAEINGGDDNAESQLAYSTQRNREWKKGSSSTTNGSATRNRYTTAQCKPRGTCDRLKQYLQHSSNKVVFVHIPKAGGTTVDRTVFGRPAGSCYSTAAEFRACDPERYSAALSFAVLRDPLSRLLSFFEYAKQGGNQQREDAHKFSWVHSIDFEAFVAELPRQRDYLYAPQWHYVNVGGRLGVDVLLCADRLEAGWRKLQVRVPTLAALRKGRYRVNQNRTMGVGDVSLGVLDSLRESYKEDFELWDRHCG
jgi:hypothetical protein